jgi:hypothetical protein
MKVKSFGCSFIFGNELNDDGRDRAYATPSQFTWPAIVAQRLQATYKCYAKPGAGNLRILEQIMHQAGLDNVDTLYIIGWTWIDRFDYVVSDKHYDYVVDDEDHHRGNWREHWEAITPTTDSDLAEFYYRRFHTQLKDKLQSLIYIRMAIDLLRSKQIPFVMTCIDDLIFDRRWQIPVSITDTQDYIKSYITDFQGRNFLDWSRHHGFPIGKWLHPLEQAHEAAATLQLPTIQKIIVSCKQ